MDYPSPDPSATLAPMHQYVVQVVTYSLDRLNWALVVGFVGLSLVLVFLVIIALATSFRR